MPIVRHLDKTADRHTALATLPLAGIASVLTALESGPQGYPVKNRVDAAGYESDGGDDDHEEERASAPRDESKEWHWRYSKSPMGSGELLLVKGETDSVNMVVRTINSAAFTAADWDEYVVTGPYNYNTKSKASWYWSRMWGACKRLQTRYFVLTDWNRWSFGCFNEDQSHAWISPVLWYNAMGPTILESLFYWAQTTKGAQNGFPLKEKDVSALAALFPSNPARRVSVSGNKGHVARDPTQPRAANESDVSRKQGRTFTRYTDKQPPRLRRATPRTTPKRTVTPV